MPSPNWNLKMLREYIVGEQISSHDGVSCYPVIKRGTEDKYMLKEISVPASATQLEALLLTGALPDDDAAKAYFSQRAHELLDQAEILRNLSQQEGFVPYLDSEIVEMNDQIGYHVYLLGSYKQTLTKILSSDIMTHADALNMGLDLCAALAACRRAGYVYADLKPENIYYDPIEGFRIGDLGFIALSSLKYTSLPNKYRNKYTPPELMDDFAVVNDTVDVYALGLVLYQVYNGGTLPFDSPSSETVLPPAIYADYALSEIISKACHPDADQRWQDPTQMAQALIDYMQNYGCAETPIIPPVLETVQDEEDEVEAFLPELDPQQLQQEMDALELEQPEELAFMSELVSDETAPSEESAADISEDVLSDETTQMLAQADVLIMHKLPDPPVAPEPIDIPMPEPIVLETEEPPVQTEENPESPDVITEPQIAEDTTEQQTETLGTDIETSQPVISDPTDASVEKVATKQNFRFPWRLVALLGAIVLVLCFAHYAKYYYDNIYTLRVDALSVEYANDSVLVRVESSIDESLLMVVCTDSYGNTIASPVKDGLASFSGLRPGTRYTVRLDVKGRRRLIGDTTDSFTTDAQTQVLSFIAVMGPEDCSVSLNFTLDGRDSDNWVIHYSADGVEEKTHTFSGNSTVIYGLQAGCNYTFTLSSQNGLFITGQTQVTYLATNILYAQDLTITACAGGNLTVQWQQPSECDVDMWYVRCYNQAGYDIGITTSELSYTFTNLDHNYACTVEVTAVGMNDCARTGINANPVTVENFTCQFTEQMVLDVRWNYVGLAPEGGWILHYSMDGGEATTLSLQEPSASIMAVPNSNYAFTIETADGRFVFGHQQNLTIADVPIFEGFGVTAADMMAAMFLWPEEDPYDWGDIPQENYRTQFSYGDRIGFMIALSAEFQNADEQIHVQIVLHDDKGIPVRLDSAYMLWNGMWRDGHCCMEIPAVPEVSGSYSISIYFNGAFICQQEFTVI